MCIFARLLKRDSASMILVGNGVDSFQTIIMKYVYRFMNRLVSSNSSSNTIVKCLSDNYTVKKVVQYGRHGTEFCMYVKLF